MPTSLRGSTRAATKRRSSGGGLGGILGAIGRVHPIRYVEHAVDYAYNYDPRVKNPSRIRPPARTPLPPAKLKARRRNAQLVKAIRRG